VLVVVDLTYNLPRWTHPRAATSDSWKRFLESQRAYLDRIARIAIEGGQERLRALRQLGTYASCDELDAAAHRTNEAIYERYSREYFDVLETTDNGRTMGVHLP
jgi:predicted secreted Zn-dependent protease